ncbi:class I SAM-dependent methyltransferase [Lacihabitans sp. CCS-44]|uniref:class I SAM-dependent methyltransferase n=1 Tax=Lacihabitans sp. CCS-44 TaxID=2487331 RepID=UPI0020CC28BD|nr:class I SAM-dependent methyltransferase [Lacihabitans sp. CCS-44]MCP9754331.1 class I SAM-dependent methyltransferase [Lacihabitans sp. CCS-44]
MKKKILRFLKKIWFLNFVRRMWAASNYFNYRYFQIFKWGLNSNEDTNFTYDITSDNRKVLIHTISAITNTEYNLVEKYIEEIENDQYLVEIISQAIENSDFKHVADKKVKLGRRIGWYAFIRILRPKVVIETGVDKGLGSLVICSALLKNKEDGFEGKYYGTDINPDAGYFLQGKFKTVGSIIYGDSITSLKSLNETIDLFINDSDHSANYEFEEYMTIANKLSKGAIILGDNSHCTSKLADFSLISNRKFLFYQEIPKDHWYVGSGIGISYN